MVWWRRLQMSGKYLGTIPFEVAAGFLPSFESEMNLEYSRFKIFWICAINLELEQYYSIFHTFFLNLAAQWENLKWFSVNLGGFMFFYIETIWSVVFPKF